MMFVRGLRYVLMALAAVAVSGCVQRIEPDWDHPFADGVNMPVMGDYSVVAVDVKELSGICLTQDKSALWAVGDGGQLARIAFDGTTEKIKDFRADLEAVTLDPATGNLYFAVERVQKVWCVAPPDYDEYQTLFKVCDAALYLNNGLEGITWYKDNALYVGAQHGATLWRCSLDGEVLSRTELKSVAPAIREVADLCYDPVTDCLWVADSEAKVLFVFSGDASSLLGIYNVDMVGNAESVCVDHANGCVWVGDDDSRNPALYRINFLGLDSPLF